LVVNLILFFQHFAWKGLEVAAQW